MKTRFRTVAFSGVNGQAKTLKCKWPVYKKVEYSGKKGSFAPPLPEERLKYRWLFNSHEIIGGVCSIKFSWNNFWSREFWGFEGSPSDFYRSGAPLGPGKQRLSYGKLVRRQSELCEWRHNVKKKQKRKKKKTKIKTTVNKQTKLSVPMPWLLMVALLRRGGRMHCLRVFWQIKLFFSRR